MRSAAVRLATVSRRGGRLSCLTRRGMASSAAGGKERGDGKGMVEEKRKEGEEAGGQLAKSILEEVLIKQKPKPTTFTGKVAEKAENTFLYAAAAASIAALGAFAYILLQTFFAEDSPNKIYSRALSMIRDDGRCQDLFGASIAGFGEGKRRRSNIASHAYEKDGEQRVRVLFHIKGDRAEGNAQVEVAQRDGDWETRFLFVETRTTPKITHVLIDNR